MSEPRVDATAISPAFVPRFRDGVSRVPVADEAVLYAPDGGGLHRLDRIGALVTACFDGRTPLGVIVDDLAEAFATERGVVEADVLRLVGELVRLRLLDGSADEDASPHRVPEPPPRRGSAHLPVPPST